MILKSKIKLNLAASGSQKRPNYRLRTVRWLLLNLIVPYIAFLLVAFVPTRNLVVASTLSALVFSVVSPLAAYSFYKGRIHDTYPLLRFSKVHVCPLCGEKIDRERFTKHLLLVPYGFKSLRHYELAHQELGKDARRSRLSMTIFLDYFTVMFGALFGFGNLVRVRSQVSFLEALGAFFVPFFVLELVLWLLIYRTLIVKKGTIFDS